MGAAFSSSNAIHVQTSKPAYYPGEVLEGVVALSCLNRIDITGIGVELVGVESTHYSTYESGTSSSFDDDTNFSSGGTRTHYGHVEFLKVYVPFNTSGTIEAGTYQFNFKINLPSTLPPSFYFSKGGDRGEIKYQLQGRASKSGFSFDMKGQKTTVTILPYQGVNASPVSNAVTKNVMSCCCLSQGQATARISLNKDVVICGENTPVLLEGRNNSSQSFQSFEVNLKRRVKLASNQGGSTSFNTQIFSETVASTSTPGLRQGEVVEGSTARQVSLWIPNDLPPTLEGSLIQCHYVAEARMKGNVGTKSLRINVPVRLLPSPSSVNTKGGEDVHRYTTPPPEWKPREVFEGGEANISNSFSGSHAIR